MWGTIVAADGTVCAVAFSGSDYTSQWLGSRVISAQKASTGNDFSVGNGSAPGGSAFPTGLALSTANLYSAVQPGGSLYGLQHSNPVDTEVAYANTDNGPVSPGTFGTRQDPMVGLRVGGVNVFGGGFGAYQGSVRVGGVGVSGDTSCTDHMVGWRLRHRLGLDQLGNVAGVSGMLRIRITLSSTSRRTPRRHGDQQGRIRTSDVPEQPDPRGRFRPSRHAMTKWRSASALRRSAAFARRHPIAQPLHSLDRSDQSNQVHSCPKTARGRGDPG